MSFTQDHKNTTPISFGTECNNRVAKVFIEELIDELPEILEEMGLSEKPTTGDRETTHYCAPNGKLSLEGGPVPQWMESDTTAADILEGDGR